MSLLEGGMHYEPCEVFLEEVVIDSDGNHLTKRSQTPIPAMARFQVLEQTGTSARRSEIQDDGFLMERFYRMRMPRSFKHILGLQSQVRWRGKMWNVFGDEVRYNSSPRTRHITYMIRRQ